MGVDMESLAEATSGAIGSLVSTTVLYPLDTCKSKFQAEIPSHHHQKYRNISDVFWEAISTQQVLSLYQGLGTKNVQSFMSSFIYFYGYSFFKRLYLEKTGFKSIGTRANLIIAAAAAGCTVILTHPLDTASSRMQTSEFGKSKGLWRTLTDGSWVEAYDGIGISLILTSNPSIQYTAFDQLKNRMMKVKKGKKQDTDSSPQVLSAFSAFVMGAVAKCIATCITYPLIRCKVTIQSAETEDDDVEDEKSRRTMMGAMYVIWKREGIFGCNVCDMEKGGLQPQILKTVLSSALLLMIKEKISKITWVFLFAVGRYLFTTRAKLKSS